MSSVSEILRHSRARAGLSQKQLAAALGIAASFMSDLEHGRREIGVHHLPNLPGPVRRAVVRAMIARHRAAITELRALVRSDTLAGNGRSDGAQTTAAVPRGTNQGTGSRA